MYYKKYCLFFLYFIFTLLLFNFTLNFIVDPLHLTESTWTDFFTAEDERKTKCAYLARHPRIYDSVIIGSSRSSYIDISVLDKQTMFNMSVSGICLNEYAPYLSFFQKTQGTPKLIILFLDFLGANKNRKKEDPSKAISFGFWRVLSFWYYVKYPLKKVLCTLFKKPSIFYTRNLVKKDERPFMTDEILKKDMQHWYTTLRYYIYEEKYEDVLRQIKEAFPYTKIVVLLGPVYKDLYALWQSPALFASYARWLNTIHHVFDTVFDFTYDQDIVNDPKNFSDAYHYFPFVGEYMLKYMRKQRAF